MADRPAAEPAPWPDPVQVRVLPAELIEDFTELPAKRWAEPDRRGERGRRRATVLGRRAGAGEVSLRDTNGPGGASLDPVIPWAGPATASAAFRRSPSEVTLRKKSAPDV